MDPGGILNCVWELMSSFASPIPYESPAQEKLVTIVQELTGVTSKHTILDQQLWSNLPYFPTEFSQTWQALRPETNDEEKTRRFVILQAYAAPILGLGLTPLEIYVIWALSDVAEGVMLPVRGSPDVVETMHTVEGHS